MRHHRPAFFKFLRRRNHVLVCFPSNMTLQNMAVASLLSFSPSFVLVHTSIQPTLPGIPDPLNLPKISSWQGACQHALMSWPGWVSAYHAHARAVSHVQQQQGCERCGRQLGRKKNNEPESSAMRRQMWAHHLLSASSGKRSTVTKGTSVPSNDIKNGLLFIKNRFLRENGVTEGEEVEGWDDKPASSRPCTASSYLLK